MKTDSPLWRVRVCKQCRREYRAGDADYQNPQSIFCSIACHGASIRDGKTAQAMFRKTREEVEEEEAGEMWGFGNRSDSYGKAARQGVRTCPRCRRAIQGRECYHCHDYTEENRDNDTERK